MGSGVKAHADIIRLVATLLVLQLMRVKKLEEGKLLRTLFSLDEPAHARSVQKTAGSHRHLIFPACEKISRKKKNPI